jgi:hypothetical protein
MILIQQLLLNYINIRQKKKKKLLELLAKEKKKL